MRSVVETLSKAVGGIGFLLVIGFAMRVEAEDINVNPGLWEWTTTISMPGMQTPIPPSVSRQCLTQDDVVPKGKDADPSCTIEKLDIENDTVAWTMTCEGPDGTLVHEGRLTYQGDSAEGDIQITMPGMSMAANLKGRHVGPCP